MSGPKRAESASLLTLVGVAVVVGAAVMVQSDYWVYVASIGAIQAVFGLSIGLVYGRAGMLSLCQVSLGAVGAWTVARLSADDGLPLPLTILIGAVITVPFGLLCALPALRLRQINLAIVTLGVVLAVYTVAQAGEVPGSSLLLFVSPPDFLPGYLSLFVICWGSFVILAAATILLRRSRWGLSWSAISRSERAAAAIGVSVVRSKLAAFGVAAGIAGWAGGLLVAAFGSADPANFDPVQVISLFALAVMMGAGHWEGALALGFFNAFSSAVLRQFGLSPDIGTLLFALGAVTVLGAESGGFAGDLRRLIAWAQRRRRGVEAVPDPDLRVFSAAGRVTTVDTTATPALRISGLTVRYGAVTALADVDLEVRVGEVVGLVGPNGAGKSTLIDATSGFLAGYEGNVVVDGTVIDDVAAHLRARHVRRTFQTERTVEELTPRDFLRLAAAPGVDRDEIDRVLEFIGCPPTERTLGRIDARTRKLVMIGACLVGRPRVLLIDEPAAGLTAEESEDLAVRIAEIPARFECGVLLIEHDMELVRLACSRVVVLDFGRKIADGATADVLADPAVTAAYLGDDLSSEAGVHVEGLDRPADIEELLGTAEAIVAAAREEVRGGN